MNRLKKFLLYALLVAGLWIFSDIVIYVAINGTYKTKESRIYVNSPEVIIGENKATYVNGYINGSIRNNSNLMIDQKYLKIDLYSSNDIKLGTKYVKIENLSSGTSTNFEIWYKFTGVNYATFSIVDKQEEIKQEELISEETSKALVIGALISLYFM